MGLKIFIGFVVLLILFISHEISIAPIMEEIFDDDYINDDNNAANIVETGDSE